MTDIQGAIVEGAVEVEIRIEAPAERVFDFLVVPEKLLRWLGEDGTVDARPGGQLRVTIGPDDIAVGEYVEIERPKRLSWTWGWLGSEVVPPGSSTVTFELEEDGGHTVVRVVHAGLPADGEQPDSHLQGWLHYGALLGRTATA